MISTKISEHASMESNRTQRNVQAIRNIVGSFVKNSAYYVIKDFRVFVPHGFRVVKVFFLLFTAALNFRISGRRVSAICVCCVGSVGSGCMVPRAWS